MTNVDLTSILEYFSLNLVLKQNLTTRIEELPSITDVPKAWRGEGSLGADSL